MRITGGVMEEYRPGEIENLKSQLARLRAINEELTGALKSIAANTCCDKCQEAALVAGAVLIKTQGMT